MNRRGLRRTGAGVNKVSRGPGVFGRYPDGRKGDGCPRTRRGRLIVDCKDVGSACQRDGPLTRVGCGTHETRVPKGVGVRQW